MTKDSPDETSVEKVETEPVTNAATTEEQKGEGQPLEAAGPLPVAQPDGGVAQQPNTADAEEETDRKQDEAITSLAEQTKWIKRQTNWIAGQVIASTILGGLTLGVLVYHGRIMGWQSQAMRDQTEIMKGQLQSMNDSSSQTERLIRANESLADQNRQMVSQAGEQTEALKQSVTAAEQSARASGRVAEIAQQSFYIGDRPYVFAGPIAIERFEPGVVPKIGIVFSNSGKTPAIGFKFAAAATVGLEPSPTKEAPGGIQFVPRFSTFPGSNAILAAGDKIGGLVDWEKGVLDESTINDIKASRKFLFVYGLAIYRDGLGVPHELKFCSVYMPNLELFGACNEFNSSK